MAGIWRVLSMGHNSRALAHEMFFGKRVRLLNPADGRSSGGADYRPCIAGDANERIEDQSVLGTFSFADFWP
jgi:hypothetical protein